MRWLRVLLVAALCGGCTMLDLASSEKLVEIEAVDPEHYDLPDGLSDSGLFPGRFRWAGRPDSLAKLVATRLGYEYVEAGPVAKLPAIRLELNNPMPVHILATAGRRLGDRGHLRLDVGERRVVLEAKAS